MTLVEWLLPPLLWEPPTSWRWMAALLYFFLPFPPRPNLIALSTREAIIMTKDKISKSVMISPPSTFVFRGEKPSAICFLPAGSPKASRIFYHNGTHPSNNILNFLPEAQSASRGFSPPHRIALHRISSFHNHICAQTSGKKREKAYSILKATPVYMNKQKGRGNMKIGIQIESELLLWGRGRAENGGGGGL